MRWKELLGGFAAIFLWLKPLDGCFVSGVASPTIEA
jgi:hypothetical protein